MRMLSDCCYCRSCTHSSWRGFDQIFLGTWLMVVTNPELCQTKNLCIQDWTQFHYQLVQKLTTCHVLSILEQPWHAYCLNRDLFFFFLLRCNDDGSTALFMFDILQMWWWCKKVEINTENIWIHLKLVLTHGDTCLILKIHSLEKN